MHLTKKDILYLLLLAGVVFYTWQSRPRLAYVRSEVLVNEFQGMKEAGQAYQQKQREWQSNLDTLQTDFARAEKAGASAAQLAGISQNIQQYAAQVEQLAREEDRKMTQAVLEQINTFVEQYGKEKGYDLILGTTTAGNILYGKPGIDITEELLEALNKHYNPGKNGR